MDCNGMLMLVKAYFDPILNIDGICLEESHTDKNLLIYYIGSLPSEIFYFISVTSEDRVPSITMGISFNNSKLAGPIYNKLANTISQADPQALEIIWQGVLSTLQYSISFPFKITSISEYVKLFTDLIQLTVHELFVKIQATVTLDLDNEAYPRLVVSCDKNLMSPIFSLVSNNTTHQLDHSEETRSDGTKRYILSMLPIFSEASLTRNWHLQCSSENQAVYLDLDLATQKIVFGRKYPYTLTIEKDLRGRLSARVTSRRYLPITNDVQVSDHGLRLSGSVDLPPGATINRFYFGYDDKVILAASELDQSETDTGLEFRAFFPTASISGPELACGPLYPLMIEVSFNNRTFTTFVTNNDDIGLNKHKVFPDSPLPFTDGAVSIKLSYDSLERLTIQFVDEFSIRLSQVRIYKGILLLEGIVSASRHQPGDANIELYLQTSNKTIYPDSNSTTLLESGDKQTVSELTLPSFIFESQPIQILARYLVKDLVIRTSFLSIDSKAMRAIQRDLPNLRIVSKDGRISIESVTKPNRADTFLAFGYALLSVFKFFYKWTLPKNLWLIGEDGGSRAEDNGLVLFTWVRKNLPSFPIYYVIDSKSSHLNNVTHLGNIIYKDSLKHWFFYIAAARCVGTHSLVDTQPTLLRSRKNNKRRVMLIGHGTSGLKRIAYSPGSYNSKIRMFRCTSHWEKSVWSPAWKGHTDYLKVCGMPRYDRLDDTSSTQLPRRQIVVFPTWRDWYGKSLTPPEESPLLTNIQSLLFNGDIGNLLEEHNMELIFYSHPYSSELFSNLTNSHNNSRIIYLNSENKPLCELISSGTVLITDYSSVAFDYNFLRKNVIFYQFDFFEYAFYRGSYTYLDIQTFGWHAYSVKEVTQQLRQIAENDFKYTSRDKRLSTYLYPFGTDRKNCMRTFQAISTTKL